MVSTVVLNIPKPSQDALLFKPFSDNWLWLSVRNAAAFFSYTARILIAKERRFLHLIAVVFLIINQLDISLVPKKRLIIMLLLSAFAPAQAATQCGPFYIKSDSKGWFSVNGERAKTQKVTFAREKGDYSNATVKIRVKNSKATGMVDMEQTNRDGKGLLRAEIVRTSQSQIRIRGDYDCEPAK